MTKLTIEAVRVNALLACWFEKEHAFGVVIDYLRDDGNLYIFHICTN